MISPAEDTTCHQRSTWRVAMTAIARAFLRASKILSQTDTETLKTIAIFCGVGLLLSLLLVIRGVDLSPGFF
jgi:choline-glycine betaine transporter